MVNLVFILPKISRYPVGGYKMVYEYTNRLINSGYHVDILYLNNGFMKKYKIPQLARNIISSYLTKHQPKWFNLSSKAGKYSSSSKSAISLFEKADVVVATAVQTVDFMMENFLCSKVYFIQGLETWGADHSYVYNTYGINVKKIVIADWLRQVVDKYSPNPCYVIKNPVDSYVYKIKKPLFERNRHSLALLYNEMPIKGFSYALKAVYRLKELYSDLCVNMFGRTSYPDKLPEWIRYTQNANQEETVRIYNESYVFLCASIEEGYGLTGLEAMACGCVFVSTSYKGVLEYAVHNENALLSPVKSIDGLVRNTKMAFDNIDLSIRLIEKAQKTIESLSWDQAVKDFKIVLGK